MNAQKPTAAKECTRDGERNFGNLDKKISVPTWPQPRSSHFTTAADVLSDLPKQSGDARLRIFSRLAEKAPMPRLFDCDAKKK